MRRLTSWCLFALVVLVATSAEAEPSAPPVDLWASRPVVIGMAGSPWGSPIGLVGVTAEAALWQRLVVQVGVGVGKERYPFWRYAASLRYRQPIGPDRALSLGAGASAGYLTRRQVTFFGNEDGVDQVRELHGRWLDGFISYEKRLPDGFQIGLTAGVEFLTNERQSRCFNESVEEPTRGDRLGNITCSDESKGLTSFLYPVFPFVGVSVGHTLDL